MTEYKELQGVVKICGDYAAWHEISMYCEYVFGHRETLRDLDELVCEKLEIDLSELKDVELGQLEAAIREVVKEDKCDYCDIEIDTILCKFEHGKLVRTYLSI